MNLPEPYYDKDGITLYCCDNRLILPALKADLLLTDPPYGIGASRAKGFGHGRKNTLSGFLKGKAPVQARDYGDSDWDDAPPSQWIIDLMRENTKHQIIWGGNYFDLPPSRCYLVWNKLNGTNHFADCELAWTNFDKAVRMIDHKWNGFIQQAGHKEHRWHPTQKPLRVAEWCISHAPESVETILDPYSGSGTFLVAAKRAGKKAVGIELSKDYCKVTVDRLEQTPLPLFTETPAEECPALDTDTTRVTIEPCKAL